MTGPYRYDVPQLHMLAGKLEDAPNPKAHDLGRRLRRIADELSEVEKEERHPVGRREVERV